MTALPTFTVLFLVTSLTWLPTPTPSSFLSSTEDRIEGGGFGHFGDLLGLPWCLLCTQEVYMLFNCWLFSCYCLSSQGCFNQLFFLPYRATGYTMYVCIECILTHNHKTAKCIHVHKWWLTMHFKYLQFTFCKPYLSKVFLV